MSGAWLVVSPTKAFACGTLLARLTGQSRFPDASWVAHTAQKGAVRALSLDKPAISAFRATGVRFPATALGLRRTLYPPRQGCAAFGTGRQEIAAVLGMLAAVPSPAVLTLHAQQAATALATFVDFLIGPRRLDNPVGGIPNKLGNKG